MRLKIKFKTNNSTLPINNQHILNGYIHKVLGKDNSYHDSVSKYNISNLRGGKFNKDTNDLIFEKEAYFLISSLDTEFINTFIMNLFKNTQITKGFDLMGTDFISDKLYTGYNNFALLSPLILKVDGKFHTIKDDGFGTIFEQYLKKVANNHFNKNIDLKVTIGNGNHKTKLVKVKGVNNICSLFNFTLDCDVKVAEFFYYTGIGLSRGSGFGTIVPSDKFMYY